MTTSPRSSTRSVNVPPMSMPIRLEGESEETITESAEMVEPVVDEQSHENVQIVFADAMEIKNGVEELGDAMVTGFSRFAGPHEDETPVVRARIAHMEVSEMKAFVFRSEESIRGGLITSRATWTAIGRAMRWIARTSVEAW